MRTHLLISAFVGLTATAASAQCPDGTAPPCGTRRVAPAPRAQLSADARARRFLLLPFRNVTRAPAQDWLVTGAPLMLSSALGQFRDLTVVPEEQLAAARRRLGVSADSTLDATQLKRLANETDGWTAVTGNVFATGQRLRLTVQALDITTSRVLTRAETELAVDADPRGAFDQLTVRLLETTGVPAAATDLLALTTTSVDAYRAYVQGVDLYEHLAFRRAQAALLEAVRLDSTFALAWAKLALAAPSTGGFQVILDPTSLLYRATEKAAQSTTRLPPRRAQLIRSMQAWIRGQATRSRFIADSLLATDPHDVDAMEWAGPLEMFFPLLDTTTSPPRPAASWNRTVRLGREAIEQDPGRRSIYQFLVFPYAVVGGFLGGVHGTYKHELSSFMAMFIMPSDMVFVPVLRDSIEFVERSAFDRLPAAEQARLRRRGADAAMDWAERWLAAGPEDAEAHLWASRISEMRDDIPRAMRELTVAESLGVETSIENLAGRRLSLMVRAGQYAAAAALADSLLAAGALAGKPIMSAMDRRRSASVAALLLDKRWDRAAEVARLIGPATPGAPACGSLRRELVPTPYTGVRESVRRAVMDTASRYLAEMKAVAALAPCAQDLATGLVSDSTSRR